MRRGMWCVYNCTGELDKGKANYKSINACISFLPILNGKQLILVEDLANSNRPHIVQEAMVKFHGSQCGLYRFYNVLFSMYKNYKSVNNELVEEVLSGNLLMHWL